MRGAGCSSPVKEGCRNAELGVWSPPSLGSYGGAGRDFTLRGGNGRRFFDIFCNRSSFRLAGGTGCRLAMARQVPALPLWKAAEIALKQGLTGPVRAGQSGNSTICAKKCPGAGKSDASYRAGEAGPADRGMRENAALPRLFTVRYRACSHVCSHMKGPYSLVCHAVHDSLGGMPLYPMRRGGWGGTGCGMRDVGSEERLRAEG